MSDPSSTDVFTIERHGDVTLIVASSGLENLDPTLSEYAAQVIMSPLRETPNPLVVFDLNRVRYFGSMFLGVLLRCWKTVTVRGGTMVLAGVSDQVRELLRVTGVDLIWPIYDDRREAMEALLSD